MRPLTDDLTPAEQQVFLDIEEQGVHLVAVPETDGAPGFAYTVGLWQRFGQPEVLVIGLADEMAGGLLDLVADEVAEERNFDAGAEASDLLDAFPTRFVEVPVEHIERLMTVATWAYDTEPFPVVQLVYPDKHGKWPWDADVHKGFAEAQPVLGVWPQK